MEENANSTCVQDEQRLHRKPTPAGASAGRRQALCPAFHSALCPSPPGACPAAMPHAQSTAP